MRRTLVAATVACLAALSTAGCGATDPSIPSPGSSPVAGSTTETGNADAVHACDLLTEQIALAVLNRPVTVGNGGNVDIYHFGVRQSSCGYVSDDGNLPTSGVYFSMLAPVDDSGVQYVKDAFDRMTTTYPDAIPVAGYGDAAVWAQSVGQLIVLSHGLWLSFICGTGIDPSKYELEDAQRFADAVLATL